MYIVGHKEWYTIVYQKVIQPWQHLAVRVLFWVHWALRAASHDLLLFYWYHYNWLGAVYSIYITCFSVDY